MEWHLSVLDLVVGHHEKVPRVQFDVNIYG